MSMEIGDEIIHSIMDMEGTVIRVDPGIVWYSEKDSGATASIDSQNSKYWMKKRKEKL
jgi:heat shock protein HspQ